MQLFWIGIFFGFLSNLVTGLLLAIVFESLQRRRDLQQQLGELWLKATRASEAVNYSRLRKDGGAEAYALWLALQDEWLRARHCLNFALTDEKRKQLEDSISAIYELHILNSDKRNRRFLKLHPIVRKVTPDGKSGPDSPDAIETTDYVDYATWCVHNGRPEAKAEYEEFQAHRQRLNQTIDNLLHFNPFLVPRRDPNGGSQSLPDELAQTWHFGFLFSRVWKWYCSELFYSFSGIFRK